MNDLLSYPDDIFTVKLADQICYSGKEISTVQNATCTNQYDLHQTIKKKKLKICKQILYNFIQKSIIQFFKCIFLYCVINTVFVELILYRSVTLQSFDGQPFGTLKGIPYIVVPLNKLAVHLLDVQRNVVFCETRASRRLTNSVCSEYPTVHYSYSWRLPSSGKLRCN